MHTQSPTKSAPQSPPQSPTQLEVQQVMLSKPCFFWNLCHHSATVEKAGRCVCRGCAGRLRGKEYPLRGESEESLYLTGRSAAEALDMLEDPDL